VIRHQHAVVEIGARESCRKLDERPFNLVTAPAGQDGQSRKGKGTDGDEVRALSSGAEQALERSKLGPYGT